MSFSNAIQQHAKANRDLLIDLPYFANVVWQWNPETRDYEMGIQYGTTHQDTPAKPAAPYACQN
mgnify:CR=1 FL=1